MASAPTTSPSTAPAALVPVALPVFRQLIPNCDVYIGLESKHGLTLYRKKGQAVDPADLDRLSARHQPCLCCRCGFRKRTGVKCAGRVSGHDPASVDRYNLLREISRASFEAAYHSGEVGPVVDFVQELAPQLTEVLSDSDLVLAELFALMSHDDGTYSHSVNVATYTMLLAKYMGIHDHGELCEVATGGLLHDLGKRHIELSVLNKPGTLDGGDRRTMADHPRLGFQDLLQRGNSRGASS